VKDTCDKPERASKLGLSPGIRRQGTDGQLVAKFDLMWYAGLGGAI